MKTKLISLLVTVLAATATCIAASVKVGDLYYEINKTDLEAHVTYQTKDSTNYAGLTSITIPDSIRYKGYIYKIDLIDDGAFRGCSTLESVIIGNNVKRIGKSSFKNCYSLKFVSIPNKELSIISDSAFAYCTSLTSLTIPNCVWYIMNAAFTDCYRLFITVSNSSTNIYFRAFYGVPYVEYYGDDSGTPEGAINSNGYRDGYLVYEDSNKKRILTCQKDAVGAINIPNTVTTIKDEAFAYCDSISSVIIPNGVTSIGNNLFSHCSSLSSVVIPNSVTSIGNHAFESCSSLSSINIPNSVTSIGYCAFQSCRSLYSVVIPNNVTSIESDAFAYCSSLSSVVIPNSVTTIGESAFAYCSSLSSVVIPNSVTYLGGYAFMYCSNLSAMSLPNGLTEIKSGVFCFCSSLSSAVIPNSVTTIGDWAFIGCSSLSSVTFPNNNLRLEIGSRAFDTCPSLSCIQIPDEVTYFTIDEYAFENCSGLTSISIPKSVEDFDISGKAFLGCSAISSIEVEEGNTTYDSRDNCNAIIETATNSLRLGCKSTVIPNSVTSIGDYAFQCGLTFLKIPESIKSLGRGCLQYCQELKSMFVSSITPPKAGEAAFGYYDNYNTNLWHGVNRDIPIYIPRGKKLLYQSAAEWRYFTNFIEIQTTTIENTDTDADENLSNTQNRKMYHNGQILIKNGDKTYTATGLEINYD